MGASNFYYKNILAVIDLEDAEQQNNEFLCEDIVNDTISNIQHDLNKINIRNVCGYEEDDFINNFPISNNYGGKLIYTIKKETEDYIMYIQVILYSGYYSSANVDYNIIYEGLDITDEDAEIKADNKTNDKLIDKVINIIKEYTENYKVTAKFSNGETIYNKK